MVKNLYRKREAHYRKLLTKLHRVSEKDRSQDFEICRRIGRLVLRMDRELQRLLPPTRPLTPLEEMFLVNGK